MWNVLAYESAKDTHLSATETHLSRKETPLCVKLYGWYTSECVCGM